MIKIKSANFLKEKEQKQKTQVNTSLLFHRNLKSKREINPKYKQVDKLMMELWRQSSMYKK